MQDASEALYEFFERHSARAGEADGAADQFADDFLADLGREIVLDIINAAGSPIRTDVYFRELVERAVRRGIVREEPVWRVARTPAERGDQPRPPVPDAPAGLSAKDVAFIETEIDHAADHRREVRLIVPLARRLLAVAVHQHQGDAKPPKLIAPGSAHAASTQSNQAAS